MLNSLGKGLTALLLNGFALAALAWVAHDAWQRGVLHGMPLPAASIEVDEVALSDDGVDIDALADAHLFGTPPRQAPVVRREAPPTRLNLKLVGVITKGRADAGMALIEADRGRQQVVRVGQPVGRTDAVLVEVQRDRVLIERSGELETLTIRRPGLDSPAEAVSEGNAFDNLPVASDSDALPPLPPLAETSEAAPLPESAPLPGAESAESENTSRINQRLTLPF